MVLRYLIIALAFGVAAFHASEGNWNEAVGLFGLGGGLLCLKLARRRPGLRRVAWLGFLLTAVSIVVALLRLR